MIDLGYLQRMARYNRWQNENLYGVADRSFRPGTTARAGRVFRLDPRHASHLLWADRIWMSRFGLGPAPEGGIPQSVSMYPDWHALQRERADFDATMVGWADTLDPSALAGDLTWYSGAAKREVTKPRWLLITHVFNHQTHHRGQVHCMLTQAGGKPGDTDLPLMPL